MIVHVVVEMDLTLPNDTPQEELAEVVKADLNRLRIVKRVEEVLFTTVIPPSHT